MNNSHHVINSGDTALQCAPLILDCNETANENSARLCQTEIALIPSSTLTDLYNIITYTDQEKIDKGALRIIDIPENLKRRTLLPVSKFGLIDPTPQNDNLNLTETFFATSTEETITRKNKTEEMSCQTDLMVSPHILIEEEKAVISMNSSCQTFISDSSSTSDHDNDEQIQLYKNAAEILTEIVHDVMMVPPRIYEPAIIKPVLVKLSRTSCSAENSERNMIIPEGNTSSRSQVRNKSDGGIFDFIADNSCHDDVLYCRSDDDVSVDSTVSEISSMLSMDLTHNSIEEDLPVYAEIFDIGSNQSSVRLTYIEENIKIEISSNDLSIE